MKGCQSCGCWDSELEGCTMPSIDKWYACPIESQKPENKKALEEWINEIRSEHDDDRKMGNGRIRLSGKCLENCPCI